jgi:hypothetical protein
MLSYLGDVHAHVMRAARITLRIGRLVDTTTDAPRHAVLAKAVSRLKTGYNAIWVNGSSSSPIHHFESSVRSATAHTSNAAASERRTRFQKLMSVVIMIFAQGA